jgi:hypothetical protein
MAKTKTQKDKTEQQFYDMIKGHVVGLGIYQPIDELELTKLAQAFFNYQECDKEVKKLKLNGQDKGFSQTDLYCILKHSSDQIKLLSDKFGLTAYGRKRLGKMQEVQKEEENPLDKYI